MSGIPLLMNTKAGAMHAVSGQAQLRRMAQDAGLDIDIIHTQSRDELKQALRRLVAEGVERVAVAGGDGTVELAVQELAHTQTAIGILSQGTFNNFATTLRLPHNLPAALETLKNGVVRAVDLGKVGDRYFTESAGVGLFADALALYGQGSNKNFLRGVYAFTRLSLAFRAREVTLTLDGQVHAEHVMLCEVANTYRIGQAIPIAPEASIEDGLLDVIVIADIRRSQLPAYLRALRAQMHLGLPKVHAYRAREVTIESASRRNVHADDGAAGTTPVTISVQPRALKVIVDDRI